MRIYETLFIIDPTLEEEARNKLVDRVKNQIEEKMGGKIRKIDRWGVRQLAFKVQKFNEGDYTIILFDADPSKIRSLEELYRVVPEIFRHLILRREDLEKHPTIEKQEKEEKTEEITPDQKEETAEVTVSDNEGENS
ncbi:30S ribosomal protein S6 [Athalassotoga saccharophila]|uniref:30S ribosomal protein S6 n=1 Tax=Athalassotoga saccharophila TaxID=1441386 RepID=UPI00137B40C9|nr:30S ribosomal protein S6 [Athalassotoga saccharophila]BBJ28747.1 30S ribosomal protein S6 [Athalassotoga saccharophila]